MTRSVTRTILALVPCGLAATLTAGAALLGHAPTQAFVGQTRLLPQWKHWRYFRAIETPPTEQSRLVAVWVPQEVYTRSARDLADVRVIDDRGDEVPFVRATFRGSSHTAYRAVAELERSFVPENYTQVVLDLGPASYFHNGLLVDTPEANFIVWAEVDVSDDAHEWRTVNERAPLFRFERKNARGNLTLSYQQTNAEYVRLRIFSPEKSFPIGRVMVLDRVTIPAERVPVAARFAAAKSRDSQTSVWLADLGGPLPLDEVDLETTQPEFSRSVSVFASPDGEDWDKCGTGEIYRFRRDDAQQESLGVDFFEKSSRYWRVEVGNGNDPPLDSAHVTAYMTPRRLGFRQEPGRRYLLIYGQSEAKTPHYDLAQTVSANDLRTAPLVQAAASDRVNAAWLDPRPWTEKHPAALWVAAILAALLLGFATVQSMRKAA